MPDSPEPLHLLRSDIIPPCPTHLPSSVSFLPDFAGSSWIAFSSTSSLLTISHFPSPSSQSQSFIGPSFRQVIDLSSYSPQTNEERVLTAVSWSTEVPSRGEIAAAVGEIVFILSPRPNAGTGSFHWTQMAGLSHSFSVQAIGWTGSGDGFIVCGMEVILWKKNNTSWEITWKSKVKFPQSLISATYSADGPIATAAKLSSNSISTPSTEYACVSVYHNTENYVQLRHPHPVTKIQWRPSSGYNIMPPFKDVLLTCCIDGTVRLWSEIDNAGAKKYKEQQSFYVIAVIEINQCLDGTLETDIFIEWAVELGSPISQIEGSGYSLFTSNSEHDIVGKCEWLISIGPNHTVAFWAIHCLDDINPLRFPRVTLWKKQNLLEFESYTPSASDITIIEEQLIFVKALILRNTTSGPPVECSLIQLLPGNLLCWSQLYSQKQNNLDVRSTLSCLVNAVLNVNGHTGNIIQLDIHPYREIELAASLDSNGFLFFWSLPTVSNNTWEMQMFGHPSWKLLHQIDSRKLFNDVNYSSIKWSPSVSDENIFLLLGHDDGVDCLHITVSEMNTRVSCDKIFTVPFTGVSHVNGPPDQISAIHVTSSSEQPFYSNNNFLLFALWTNKLKFQALSWKIMLHAANASSSSLGKLFNAVIDLGSSAFPDSQNEAVTSVFVCAQSNCMLSTQLFSRSYTSMLDKYHMATGYSSGILKLWKMSYKESQISLPEFVPWELVGTITAHDGAVNVVSLSCDGSKISTISVNNGNNSSTLHIWEPIHLVNGGSFLLEDEISIDGSVVSLDWLSLGNGHFLLAVFMPSEVRIYSERRFDPIIEKTVNKTDMHIWCCIAISHISPISHGFLWGSMLAPVIIHKKHFSLYSQRSYKAKGDGRSSFPIFVQTNAISCTKLLENGGKESGIDVDSFTSKTLHNHNLYSDEIPELHSLLDIADALNKTVEVYHPKVLLQHLYLGSWKRAYSVLKHLVKAIKFGEVSAISSISPLSQKSRCSVPEIDLSSYFEEVVLEESSNKDLQWGQNLSFQTSSASFQHYSPADDMSHNFSPATNLKSEVMGFIDTIEKSGDTNALKNIEKSQLLAIIDLLLELRESNHSSVYDSLDAYGRRLWVTVQFQRLYSVRKFGKSICEEPCTDSRYFAWASQSECQDNLLNSLLSSNPSWSEMRSLGIGFWFTDTSQLRAMMEKLARSQYLMKRDPKDCALLYLALNRLQVLAGLFKVSRDEKDKLLVGFLSRNFKEEKNKAAALKNAYVLMGRHQLELAIAFFLLGGDPSSAVTVCAKNLGDEQLALVICRLIEGHGGQLEHQLISNTLIPKALDKKDYWLASLLEWQVGNYTSSVNSLLDSNLYSEIYSSALYNLSCCLDPDIGQYCAALATKNSMKNSVGEYPIMVLSKLAKFMSAKAFNRCGFPLEALECLSSSSSSNEACNQISLLNIENHMIFRKILSPFSASVCNWQQAGIADTSELNARLNFAMQYITKSLKSHPSWLLNDYTEKRIANENDVHQDEKLNEFIHELKLAIGTLERKYFLKSADIANEILVFTNTRGLFFHGCRLLHVSNIFRKDSDVNSSDKCSTLPTALSKLLIKASQEISCIFCRFIVCCSLTDSILGNKSLCQFHSREVCLNSIVMSLRSLRPHAKLCESSLVQVSSLDPLECSVHFASYWFGKNVTALMSIIGTFVNEPIDHHSSIEVRINALMKLLQHTQWINSNFLSDGPVGMSDIQQSEAAMLSQSDYEMWQVIGACLWIHLSKYLDNQFRDFLEQDVVGNGNIILDTIKLLLTSTDYISSMLTRQLSFFLRQKASESQSFTFAWLNRLSHINSKEKNSNMEIKAEEEVVSQYKTLWELSVHPDEICNSFVNERLVCFPYKSKNIFAAWKYVCKATLGDKRNGLYPNVKAQEDYGNFIPTNEESASDNNIDVDPLIETKRQISSPRKNTTFFHNPVEILKRNGELLEAICSNSIDEHQLAAASNRKGLCFFNYKSDQNFRKHDEYLWLESDWPRNGWGGCESKLGSSYVSGGIGVRSKSEAHLGFDDGAVGFNSLSRPERYPTVGNPFESPGYARIGASSLSWYEQEEFDEFTDPPATVTNVSSQALSRHPCRPFLLVGSINTHIYLWEFGKDSATATYGVLPSANVPPPYALASVSALQFDHCGNRFASAAFDGTVCTWQLEVGGRGNAYPTESSHCFSNYAADIDYVAASGSIIAAAGSNINGINVVLWDTLAPPGTSQASLVCHEGGARSLSVFDNDIGTGSVSPLIVTGGKSGDVGLHDFRFIATGKTKRNKSSSHQDNGMLWYIPKAHLGSVTKVITVPNTSLFLTGSKDGDVKLWDAKNTRLVYHWQKMHERHTFLQPYSRSIGGGVVRAAVTDIQVLPRGFLTCGGDGCVKLVQLK